MNIILSTDSYKASQFNQYPEGTEYVFSYIESRGGDYDNLVFVGLQGFLQEYFTKPITREDIDEAAEVLAAHGLPFNREGWEYILEAHEGYLPVAIDALPEGSVVPTGVALVTIVNTDPKCYWLTSYLETALLRAVWYPTTVATRSAYIKGILEDYLEESGTPSNIDFMLHDFGARGVSSKESAGIGGFAHLVNFKGTDTLEALLYARKHYGASMAGFSVPAMEHSTVTSWGREGEVASYRNMVKTYGKPGSIVSAVSDSYDIYEACKLWGTELKQDVIDSGATLVVRPDSGNPADVVVACLEILEEHFGSKYNEKGFRVLNHVKVLQGDGINEDTVADILEAVLAEGFSADNVVFGMGGQLLQGLNRDTLKFAMKCSAIQVNGEWRDVYKDPITDQGKRSKRGLLTTVFDDDSFLTIREEEFDHDDEALEAVFVNGSMCRFQTLDEIRDNAW
jgi:nicotinamide phosphoribosyltransferase